MRNILILVVFFLGGCGQSDSIGDRLVGEYVYERETFSGGTFEDFDTKGLMTFRKGETGSWISDSAILAGTSPQFEWDLQGADTRIAITKTTLFLDDPLYTTKVYDLEEEENGVFRMTYFFELQSFQDTLQSIVRFENIILTPSR